MKAVTPSFDVELEILVAKTLGIDAYAVITDGIAILYSDDTEVKEEADKEKFYAFEANIYKVFKTSSPIGKNWASDLNDAMELVMKMTDQGRYASIVTTYMVQDAIWHVDMGNFKASSAHLATALCYIWLNYVSYIEERKAGMNIKHCMYCGGKGVVEQDVDWHGDSCTIGYYVKCENSSCRAQGPLAPTRPRAIAVWNRDANETTVKDA